jgi:hypothetical protein
MSELPFVEVFDRLSGPGVEAITQVLLVRSVPSKFELATESLSGLGEGSGSGEGSGTGECTVLTDVSVATVSPEIEVFWTGLVLN